MSKRQSPVIERVRSAFLHSLRYECLVDGNRPVLLGVSGGPDSMFLLEMFRREGLPFIVGLFDHGLREESGEEAEFVRNHCEKAGIPFYMGFGNVRKLSEAEHFSLEAAARKMRYGFLFQTADATGAQAIATAHHADDQAETVLLHLLRGSGPDGLSGMLPRTFLRDFSDEIPLIRPLLKITREDILSFLDEGNVPYRIDRSNYDTAYTRSRIRHELLPLLREKFNPGITETLGETAELAALDRDYWHQLTKETFDLCSCGHLRLDRQKFGEIHPALQSRLIRKIGTDQGVPSEKLGFDAVTECLERIRTDAENDSFSLAGEIRVRLRSDVILFGDGSEAYPQMDTDCWTAEILSVEQAELPEKLAQVRRDPFLALLDSAKIAGKACFSRPETGDRMLPYGMSGEKKVSDIFVDTKTPQEYRKNYAVLRDDEGIIWIPGFRIADRVAVTKETREAFLYHITFRDTEDRYGIHNY